MVDDDRPFVRRGSYAAAAAIIQYLCASLVVCATVRTVARPSANGIEHRSPRVRRTDLNISVYEMGSIHSIKTRPLIQSSPNAMNNDVSSGSKLNRQTMVAASSDRLFICWLPRPFVADDYRRVGVAAPSEHRVSAVNY